ncbi:hypothetical protein ZWY2020_023362 [Hordeum vulgare]|nr:hypothetical protein ZWY2020_023362 [Hordeum vulgare]
MNIPCTIRDSLKHVAGRSFNFKADGNRYVLDVYRGHNTTVIGGNDWVKFVTDFNLGAGSYVVFDTSKRMAEAYVVHLGFGDFANDGESDEDVEGEGAGVEVFNIESDEDDHEEGDAQEVVYTQGCVLSGVEESLLDVVLANNDGVTHDSKLGMEDALLDKGSEPLFESDSDIAVDKRTDSEINADLSEAEISDVLLCDGVINMLRKILDTKETREIVRQKTLKVKNESETCYGKENHQWASTKRYSYLKAAIERTVGDTLNEKVKEDIYLSFQQHMREEGPNTCSKVKNLILEVIQIVTRATCDSGKTLKIDSSANQHNSTNHGHDSEETVKVNSNGEYEEEDEATPPQDYGPTVDALQHCGLSHNTSASTTPPAPPTSVVSHHSFLSAVMQVLHSNAGSIDERCVATLEVVEERHVAAIAAIDDCFFAASMDAKERRVATPATVDDYRIAVPMDIEERRVVDGIDESCISKIATFPHTALKLCHGACITMRVAFSPCVISEICRCMAAPGEVSGDREVQRTMLELLNQLDGFSSDERIKVIAATNRADILDPALLRSGRLDRKIEFPHPTEEARARILQIHSRKMNVHPDVNFEELARSTDDFNGAQLKAVCVEAGMLALRRDATEMIHEDFNEGIIQVQAKKKSSLNYYA